MLITDIETDGLLDSVTRFHCAAVYDTKLEQYTSYRPSDFKRYLDDLEKESSLGGLIVFHNGINYDIPALKKLAKKVLGRTLSITKESLVDTLVLSRLIHSNLKDTDMPLVRAGKLPGRRYGSHALEAWGYRLGEMKGEYKDDFKKLLEEQGEEYTSGAEWLNFNEPMMEYCVQDVKVTLALLEKLLGDNHYFPTGEYSSAIEAVSLEHKVAWLMAKQERNGFPFDTKAIEELYVELASKRSELLQRLVETFGSWYQPKGASEWIRSPRTGKLVPKGHLTITPKVGGFLKRPKNKAQREGIEPCEKDTRLFVIGASYTPVEYTTFKPSSRDHIQRKLQEAGWVPKEFTEKGVPKVDDEVLKHVKVDDPEKQASIDLIKEYLMIQKRIGQTAEGDKAWLRYVKTDGKIHGSVNPNGAVTGRATHSFPNIAQVPGGKKPYAKECRAAFGAEHHLDWVTGKPWVQVGVDASGLELRALGHFTAKFDGGEYSNEILNGDIHTKNQMAARLQTRGEAKTLIYRIIYGSSPKGVAEALEIDVRSAKTLMKKLLDNTPALATLQDDLLGSLVRSSTWVDGEQKVTWKRRWIKGLDGRKIHVRSPHAALNTLLQGAGALICKLWVVRLEEVLVTERGLKHGWDGDFAQMAWIHDEVQVACRTEEIAEIVKEEAQRAMRWVGDHWNFRCQLDTDGKIGANWKDCH